MRGPWTREHERFAQAFDTLHLRQLRLIGATIDLARWCEVRWGTGNLLELTPAQLRHGRRQLNAWRFSIKG